MASSEKNMRKKTVELLRTIGAFSVENGCGIGTPDVCVRMGWLELKSVDKPARAETRVECDHFTKTQRVWHRKWRRCGGLSWILVKIGKEWILFDGVVAADILGLVPLHVLRVKCVDAWPGTPDKEGLIDCLKSTCTPASDSTSRDAVTG